MKLFWSSRSPFVRKAMVTAHEVGLAEEIERRRVVVSAILPNAEVEAWSPLGKIPTLVTRDGTALYDSPVICEYLAAIGTPNTLFPQEGAARWTALRLQALGDGFMDVLVLWRAEMNRPGATRSETHVDVLARRFAMILDGLEREAPLLAQTPFCIGHIAIGAALSYADFRYADQNWRDGRAHLAAWHSDFAARPSVLATEHTDAY